MNRQKIERRIEKYLKEVREIRLNRLVPKGYRTYCFRHRNATKDHATNFAVVGIWIFFVVLAFGVLR